MHAFCATIYWYYNLGDIMHRCRQCVTCSAGETCSSSEASSSSKTSVSREASESCHSAHQHALIEMCIILLTCLRNHAQNACNEQCKTQSSSLPVVPVKPVSPVKPVAPVIPVSPVKPVNPEHHSSISGPGC